MNIMRKSRTRMKYINFYVEFFFFFQRYYSLQTKLKKHRVKVTGSWKESLNKRCLFCATKYKVLGNRCLWK